MKNATGLLLVLTALLQNVYAFPADHGKSHPFDPHPPQSYSLDELSAFFDAQESGSDPDSKMLNTGLDTKVESASGSLDQSLVGNNINLSQNVMLEYSATCEFGYSIQDTFALKILYNGKDVTFRKTSNIDAWGKVFIDHIRPNEPIYAEVPFHHFMCKPVTRQRVCSYYFAGVAEANIKYFGADQGITPNAAQPDGRPMVAYVKQTCNDKPGSNGRIACPAATGPDCSLDRIGVSMGIIN